MIEGNAAFAIGQNSYSKFIADAGLHDEGSRSTTRPASSSR